VYIDYWSKGMAENSEEGRFNDIDLFNMTSGIRKVVKPKK
jgi:hypothetical protein